jgi:hypothetical protein
MKALLMVAFLLAASWSPDVRPSADSETLTRMLNEFLAGASVNDAGAHDRFWDEDLVYTSSSGRRFGKAEIMDGLGSSPEATAEEPAVVYSAADIRIRQYGDAAVVAFRLLGTPVADGSKPDQYFNTGTFVRRGSEWRVVAWQATVIPQDD